jgi:hypothetical protein
MNPADYGPQTVAYLEVPRDVTPHVLPGHIIRDGDFDRLSYHPLDEDDYEPSRLVDLLYMSEWTGLVTVESATAYMQALWDRLSQNEKEYVVALYLGRDTAEYEAAIAADMMEERESVARDADARRAKDVSNLGDIPEVDVSGEPFEVLDAQLEVLKRHMNSVSARPAPAVAQGSSTATVQSGGAAAVNQYKLFALADSLHDFGKLDVDKAGIMAAVGAEIPTNLEAVANASDKHVKAAIRTDARARRMGHHNFRHGGSTPALEFIADEAAFIGFLNDNEFLHFRGEEPARHGTYKIDLLRQFDKATAFRDYMGLYWLAYLRQRDDPGEALKADIWALPQQNVPDEHKIMQDAIRDGDPPKNYKDIVFVSQVIHAVHKIKAAFGDGELVFIMDKTDNQLHRMVLGSATLYAGIGRMLIMIGWNDEILETADKPTPRDKWCVKVCDANLVDGNTHFRVGDMQPYYPDPEVSATATGQVFREGLGSVILGGIIEEPDDPEYPMVKVTVGQDLEQTFSHTREPFTKNDMAGGVGRNLRRGRLDEAVEALACKRACDWGQVRHCAVMNEIDPNVRHVFVSPEDRMACLYSVHENVDTIFIKCNKDSNTGWPPFMNVLQTTFTLCPRRAEAVIGQVGGGFARGVVQVALLAVVVAMSVG